MKTSLLALLFVATALLPAQTEPLHIGSWNIEFLGAPGNLRNQLPPRTDQDVQRIGAFIRSLGVAMLAVQEICGEAPLQQVAAAIGPDWRPLLGTTGGWDDGKTAQNIGFLYDSGRLELLAAEELLELPREQEGLPIFHRVPVSACFKDRRTGLDFRAITVHLKASMKPDDLKKRKLEATALAAWLQRLQATAGEDQDIVVLGDFNSTYGTDPQTVLEAAGVVRYLRPQQPGPTIVHFPEPIDQIAPSPRFAEVVADSFTVQRDDSAADLEAWRRTYSDHFPVTIALRADGDDDPQATFARGPAQQRLPASQRATAAAAAAAAAAAPPPARRGGAIAPGAVVTVACDGDLFSGTLLEPLGDWIHLRDERRGVVAVPAHRVRLVTLVQ